MRRITVLGPLTAVDDGTAVDLGGPTQRKLLASLVAAAGAVVSVPALLEGLWGDEPPPTAPATIQSYVSRLRKALGPNSIVTEAPGYRFDDSEVEVDANAFLDLLASLPTSTAERADTLSQALQLWKGPAFESFPHLEIEARTLEEKRLAAEENLAADLRQLGRYEDSLAAADHVIAAEPLRESAWLQRALSLHAAGRQPEAINTLNEYRARIADMGLEPTKALRDTEDLVFEEPTPSKRPVLPLPPDGFVGRARDIENLETALSESRLVTIVGPGGMGKTRLALEVLAGREEPELVWFAALGSVANQTGVLPAVLNSIGVEARGDPLTTLIQRMGTMSGLLYLDNCEHVIDEVARVVGQLTKLTPVRVLTTSREALNVAGETIVNLGPMDDAGAVQLFIERAQRVGTTAGELEVSELVGILDRMPLAIEMAASRSTAMSVPELTKQLGETLGLLERQRRGDTPRHETLDALVGWSYDLLDDVEQIVFQRLSVFSGRFGINAATQVVCFDRVDPSQLPALIASLVDRSLLVRRQDGGYRMLRVLRSFASDKLGTETEPRRHHAAFFAALSGRIGAGLAGPDELKWIGVARAATEDMAAALRFAVDSAELEIANDILQGLFDWFYHRQPPALVDWGDVVLDVAGDHPVVPIAAAWSALAAMKRGQVDDAMQRAEMGIAFTDGPEARYPLFMAGDIACFTGDLDVALDMFDKQLVRASETGDTVGVIDAVAGEALALSYQGMYSRALAVAEGIETTARKTGSPTYMAYADYTLGEAIVGSDRDRAIDLFDRAIATARTVDNQFIEGMSHTARGWAHLQADEIDEARRSLKAGLEVYCDIGAASYTWTAIRYLALAAAGAGDDETATVLMSAAEAAGRRPYGSDEVEWTKVLERVEDNPDYRDWVARGTSLRVDEAANLAAATA